MDPLDNIPTIVEDPTNILGVDGAGEVGIAVVGVVLLAVRTAGLLAELEEVVPDEVFCPGELPVGARLDFRSGLRRQHVVDKLGEVVLQARLAGLYLLFQQVLLVQEKDHRNCS